MVNARKLMTGLLVTFFLLSAVGDASAGSQKGTAQSGMKTAKAVFDVNVTSPEKLLFMLEMVERTFRELRSERVRPLFVVAFRGQSSKYLIISGKHLTSDQAELGEEIAEMIKRLKKTGMRLEQCYISAEIFDIESGEFYPELLIVQNGYLSLIKYQAKGYAYVPMQ